MKENENKKRIEKEHASKCGSFKETFPGIKKSKEEA